MTQKDYPNLLIAPNIHDRNLTTDIIGTDHLGNKITAPIINEIAVTVFLNRYEIVTNMTIGDYRQYLALGYLYNQNIIKNYNDIDSIDDDEELGVVVVRTKHETDFEHKLHKKIRTSGCAQGTIFGDIMDNIDSLICQNHYQIKISDLYQLSHIINRIPSLYLKSGAIHGCVLAQNSTPLLYMEDVGRHNAVDKIAGYMLVHHINGHDKIFYTTGRLTSEMVIKTAMMRIPILVSRSGFTAWGVNLARQLNITLIGRMRGNRFLVLSGEDRVIFDHQHDNCDNNDEK